MGGYRYIRGGEFPAGAGLPNREPARMGVAFERRAYDPVREWVLLAG